MQDYWNDPPEQGPDSHPDEEKIFEYLDQANIDADLLQKIVDHVSFLVNKVFSLQSTDCSVCLNREAEINNQFNVETEEAPNALITREEAEEFIRKQLSSEVVCARDDKGDAWHYGRMELIELLDTIYGPRNARPVFMDEED